MVEQQVSDSAHWAACELMDALLRLGNGATIEDRTGLIEEHMEAHGVAREMAERERCASMCICTAAGNVTRNNAPTQSQNKLAQMRPSLVTLCNAVLLTALTMGPIQAEIKGLFTSRRDGG